MPDRPGFEQLVFEQIYQLAEQRGKAMAAEMGKPPGTKDMNDEREIIEWLRGDDSIDVAALLAAGTSIEDITRAKHPVRIRMIKTHSPDLRAQCLYAQKMAKKAAEYQAQQQPPALSALDALGPVEAPVTNGAGYE